MSREIEKDLEDYVWGRIKEQDYLERIVNSDAIICDHILKKVCDIDETLNKQLRKGVEDNLSRLLEQTTALEALDRTQRGVHSEMNIVHNGCDNFAKNLDLLLCEYRQQTDTTENLITVRNLVADSLRCEELMDSFEKRNELVKRSEIICEIRGIAEDNPDLLSISWLRDTLTSRLAAIENEVRRAAADDLRRALISLNASLVASATRALTNLGVLETELEVQLSSSAAEVDVKLVELSTTENSDRLLPVCVNMIHSLLEQCALLGTAQMNRFTEKLARIIRSRVPLDAPFALRLVQQMGRVLLSRPEYPLGPVNEALRPLKNSLLSHALSRLHHLIEQHDFTSAQVNVFVDLLSSAIEEEINMVEWDNDLCEEMHKNIRKCIDMVAEKLETEMKLDSENLLLGDRLGATQLVNYRILQTAHSLANKWPAHSASLLHFVKEATDTILGAVRCAISSILRSMHTEKLSGKDTSPYMLELLAYLKRVNLHASHLSPIFRQCAALSTLVDFIIHQFILNASLIRPVPELIRHQLFVDFTKLLEVTSQMGTSTLYTDSNRLLSMFGELPLTEWTEKDVIPPWAIIHNLIANSPDTLLSPHTSVEWPIEEYVKWCSEHTDKDILAFLNGLMRSYTASVISRGETEYVPHYPAIMSILKKSMA